MEAGREVVDGLDLIEREVEKRANKNVFGVHKEAARLKILLRKMCRENLRIVWMTVAIVIQIQLRENPRIMKTTMLTFFLLRSKNIRHRRHAKAWARENSTQRCN